MITPRAMTGWWGRDPQGVVGQLPTGLSAALWNFWVARPIEVCSQSDQQTNILSIQTRSFRHETWNDGRLVYKNGILAGSANIVTVGVRPRAVLYDGIACLQIYIPQEFLQRLAEQAEVGGTSDLALIDPALAVDPVLAALGRSLLAELLTGDPISRLAFDGYSQTLCAHLLRCWSNRSSDHPTPYSGKRHRVRDWRIRRTIDRLEAGLASDIGLAEVAAAIGLSPRHLSALFRAATGMSPHQWVMQRRVERAREMLGNSKFSIMDIAHACGFASSQHLATVFRKHTGATPTHYRREIQS